MSTASERLLEYCRKTNMTYSYKPVLIMALIDGGGSIRMQDAARYFARYYGNRLSLGLVAEQDNSIYSNLNCTLEQIIANIKANSLKALLNSGDFFVYDSQSEQFSLVPEIRAGLTADNRREITEVCLTRLDDYYARIHTRVLPAVVCFHKPEEENGYLSNWYASVFSFRGIQFTSVEQYMMYRKALMFEDSIARKQILSTDDVSKIKQLGRNVQNYNGKLWSGQRQLIVYQGLLAKFTQNAELRTNLLNTGSSLLAECAVSDKVWGIGLSMHDDRRFLMNQWQGENLLGFALMQVRNAIQEARAPECH